MGKIVAVHGTGVGRDRRSNFTRRDDAGDFLADRRKSRGDSDGYDSESCPRYRRSIRV
jgi:hypothetical protein